jgi:hypothetical protein
MSDTPTRIEVDCTTGEVHTVILSPAEIAERDQMSAQFAIEQAARETTAAEKAALKESAKAKLVAGEPLTADEAAVLVI